MVFTCRLASVQEQRLPCEGGRMSPGPSGMSMEDQHPHETNPSVHSKVKNILTNSDKEYIQPKVEFEFNC